MFITNKNKCLMNFNNKHFKTRTLKVEVGDNTRTYTIADESLLQEINSVTTSEAQLKGTNIDEQIYFYVDKGQLELPAKEICEKHLDVPMKFVEEIF